MSEKQKNNSEFVAGQSRAGSVGRLALSKLSGMIAGTRPEQEREPQSMSVTDFPALRETGSHEQRVEYCRGTTQKFVENAKKHAEALASESGQDVRRMQDAFIDLIGELPEDDSRTIFKGGMQWVNKYYFPDHKQLGVDIAEIGVPQDKITAGVSLCIGLWVKMADAGASWPGISDAPFGTFDQFGFQSLVSDTGWLEETNMKGLFREALTDPAKQEAFLAPFRDEQFFHDMAEDLQ